MKKQLFSIALGVLMVSALLSGCGKNENSSEVSGSQSTTASDMDSSLSEGFDWETVKQNITIDGKKIDFPFSVNDLGGDYEINNVIDWGEKNCQGLVVKKDEKETWVCTLYFDDYSAEDYNDNVKCTSIMFANSLTVQDIGVGTAKEEADKVFGQPYKTDEKTLYYLSKNGTERIDVCYDPDTDKVTEVDIFLNFKEEE